jgi:Mg2+ and Co2+ transporter CorA
MVEASPGTTPGLGDMTLDSLLKGANMGNLFGGQDSNGLIGGLILGSLLRNGGNLWGPNGGGVIDPNAQQLAIDAAVSAALANANQANNNSMLLLKDIQDSSQEVISSISAAENAINASITQGNQTILIQQLQAQIANLMGQGEIKTAIATTSGNIVNEIHESESALSSQMNALNTNMLQGFNNVTREISADGDKTRAMIMANLVTELNNQIADLRTRSAVDAGGVNVTNNINQNQLQQQQQQQAVLQTTLLQQLVGEIQRNTQSVVNLGTMTGQAGQQTAANTRVL